MRIISNVLISIVAVTLHPARTRLQFNNNTRHVALGYPSLETIRELVYKRGFGKVNKQRIPLMGTDVMSENLGR